MCCCKQVVVPFSAVSCCFNVTHQKTYWCLVLARHHIPAPTCVFFQSLNAGGELRQFGRLQMQLLKAHSVGCRSAGGGFLWAESEPPLSTNIHQPRMANLKPLRSSKILRLPLGLGWIPHHWMIQIPRLWQVGCGVGLVKTSMAFFGAKMGDPSCGIWSSFTVIHPTRGPMGSQMIQWSAESTAHAQKEATQNWMRWDYQWPCAGAIPK